jgi:site-specific recombinase XerD
VAFRADSSIAPYLGLTADGVRDLPFLLAPDGSYDPELNAFFSSLDMLKSSPLTREAYARDLATFFSFLWLARRKTSANGVAKRRGWRDADESDRAAYYVWRNVDENGPRIRASTWNREAATASRFFVWAKEEGHIATSPIRQTRTKRNSYRSNGRFDPTAMTSAEPRPDRNRESLRWLSAPSYLTWRDVGVRGYSVSGLRDPKFRGEMAGRDSAFTDLMIRTGMRLTEQASLSLYDLPDRDNNKELIKKHLPGVIAKNSKSRAIFYPSTVLASIDAYMRGERKESIAKSWRDGSYASIAQWVIDDPERAIARNSFGTQTDVNKLTPSERRRLFVRRGDLLEPFSLWLSKDGIPLSPKSWQSMFVRANQRCQAAGVDLNCHPHALRHSFAVITLEQLERGYIDSIGQMSALQREHFRMIFGDPLDWVRRRLGHSSTDTTMMYLHTLEELEMETRLALVGDPLDAMAFAQAIAAA